MAWFSSEDEEGIEFDNQTKGPELDTRSSNIRCPRNTRGRSKTKRICGQDDVALLASKSGSVDRLPKRNRKQSSSSDRNNPVKVIESSGNCLVPPPKRRGKVRRLDETTNARKKTTRESQQHDNCLSPRPDGIPDLIIKTFATEGSTLFNAFLSSYGSDYYAGLFDMEQLNDSKRKEVGSPETNGYMNRQPYLTLPMRGILVDWLIELTAEYKLLPETLYLAVKLVDRTLGKVKIERNMLQCVGCFHPPSPDDFVYISDSTYTKKEITGMELKFCLSHSFNLICVTPYHFIGRFLCASDLDCSTPHGVMGQMTSYL